VSGLFSMGKSRGSVTVNVVAGELQAVASSLGANADLIDITCTKLQVDASSGSNIKVSGSCDTVAVDASSGANVDSSDLITADASVDSSSGASIRVFAGESFRGDASSGSSIRVYGNPEVAESETSSGASIDLRSHAQTI
ncbi:MAG: GIN domain-containing protein, partial [Luminiphilus sp.]